MSILWDEGCVVVMWCLNVHSVGGGVCSCYVVFECPFCGMIEVSYVRWGVCMSIMWDEGCVDK